MEKKCVVNRDSNGDVISVSVIKEILNDSIEEAVRKNNGNSLDKAPNGNNSELYNDYIKMGLTPEEARNKVAVVYSPGFLTWFGDWINNPSIASKVVDSNGQPKIVWSGHPEKVENYKAYTNRSEEDRIDNDAFFPENKMIATSYSTGGAVDFTTLPESMISRFDKFIGSVEGVFLNIKNPVKVEENSGLKITPLIETAIDNNNDGFYGNTIHKENENTWAILDGSQVQSAVNNRFDTSESSEINYIKNGVNELYEANQEIALIGTKEQYSAYIDSIFPLSVVKEMAYHVTKYDFEKFERNPENIRNKTDTVGFHFIEENAVEDYKQVFGKKVMRVMLDFRNPVSTEYDNSDDNHTSQKLEYLQDENIKEFEKQGYDSGVILRPNDNEFIAFDSDQIHVLGSQADIQGFKDYLKSNNTVEYNTIPSQLYEQLKQQPFIDPDQALEIYKNIYSKELNYWKNKDLNCG